MKDKENNEFLARLVFIALNVVVLIVIMYLALTQRI